MTSHLVAPPTIEVCDAAGNSAESCDILDLLSELVHRYRASDRVITYCNTAWAEEHGIDRDAAIGRCLDDLLSDSELVGLRNHLQRAASGQGCEVNKTSRTADGHVGRWLEWVDQYVTTAQGLEVLSVGRDVTDRHLAELHLQESENRFRSLADKSTDIVWRVRMEPNPHFDYVSPSVESILGYPPSVFLLDFERILDISEADTRSQILQLLDHDLPPQRFDLRFRHANGSLVVGETTTSVDQSSVQGVIRDVTELRRTQQTTATQALHDPLTGVANRRGFDQFLTSELERTSRTLTPLSVAYLDVDELKDINDRYGHDAGDVVLREAARRLQLALSSLSDVGTVARLGGDEFAIIFESRDHTTAELLHEIDSRMSLPISISPTVDIDCAISVGIADTQFSGRRASDLVAAADQAMYRAKRRRKAGLERA